MSDNRKDRVADQEFNFEAEFSLLDIGATSSLLRTGAIRPTVLAFAADAAVEAVTLDWEEPDGATHALEEARRYVRDLAPAAYGVIGHISRGQGHVTWHLPDDPLSPLGDDFLAICLVARDGAGRVVTYPIRRSQGHITLGMPTVKDCHASEWRPLGDIWNNPFCAGDIVHFRHRERPVDPSSALWQAIVDLTRLRTHDDQENADEYMAFLDDLRNGIFVVSGRPEKAPDLVSLRPRTVFNPLGTLTVEARRIVLGETAPAEVEKVGAR